MLMERWQLSISVEKRVKLANQFSMYFVEFKKCNDNNNYYYFYTTAGGLDHGYRYDLKFLFDEELSHIQLCSLIKR